MDYVNLLATIRAHRLVDEEQLTGISADAPTDNESSATLIEGLQRRGHLTEFQFKRLIEGRGAELVLGGAYVLLDVLGEGGMGQVYKAFHRTLRAVRAIKVIHPECTTSKRAVQRFHREIQLVARLHHPNIVMAHDAGEDNGVHFLVMELVEGDDLAKLLRKRGRFSVGDAANYVRQAALGLQHAHERGLVHRDIKPSNLLLAAKSDVIKILDLGLARLRETQLEDAEGHPLTPTGVVMGTPDFMAPEQTSCAKTVDVRADVYALGCCLYQMLTQRLPFPGGDVVTKLIRHREETPEPVTKFRSDVPPGMLAVLDRMMAKQPERRFQAPQEVADALLPFQQADPTPLVGSPGSVCPDSDTLCVEDANGIPSIAPLSSPQFGDAGTLSSPAALESTQRSTGDVGSPVNDSTLKITTPELGRASRSKTLLVATACLLGIGIALGAYLAFAPRSPKAEPQVSESVAEGRKLRTRPADAPIRPAPDIESRAPVEQIVDRVPKAQVPIHHPTPRARLAVAKRALSVGDRRFFGARAHENGQPGTAKPRYRTKICAIPRSRFRLGACFSGDGTRAATIAGSEIVLIDLTTGRRLQTYDLRTVLQHRVTSDASTASTALALSEKGEGVLFAAVSRYLMSERIKTGIYDATVLLSAERDPLYFLGRENLPVVRPQTEMLRFSTDGKYFFGVVDTWVLEQRIGRIGAGATELTRSGYKFQVGGYSIRDLACSPDSRFVAAADGAVTVARIGPPGAEDGLEPYCRLKRPGAELQCVDFLSEKQLLSGDKSGSLYHWKLPENKVGRAGAVEHLEHRAQWHPKGIELVRCHPQRKLFATCGADEEGYLIRLGRLEKDRLVLQWSHKVKEKVLALSFSKEGDYVLYATSTGIRRRAVDETSAHAETKLEGNGSGARAKTSGADRSF